MITHCDNCGCDIPIKNKKHKNKLPSSDRIHKMVSCPHCGSKNFYDVLSRFDKYREQFGENDVL